MKNTNIYIILSILLLSVQLISAQYNAQKKGDYYFGQFDYAKAIPEYQKMLKGDLNPEHAHRQLAECYLLLREFKKSIPHFQMIINDASLPIDYLFKYAMALYANGERKQSAKWLKLYKKYNKNDSRLKRFLKNGNLASIVFNSKRRYEVEPVPFNSEQSDFGAFTRGGDLFFASSRTDEVSGGIYGWNDQPWLDLFVVRENDPLSRPEKIKGDVNTKFHESNLVFSTDHENDTIIYFTRNNYYKKKKAYGANNEINLKIFTAIKDGDEWKVNSSLQINGDNYSTGHPTITPDGRRIYYTSDRPGGYGGTDIYYSEIHESGRIGAPVNVGPVVNTEGNEMFPFINTENKLFFSSDGHVGFGQLDVFSTISNEEGEVTDVINLGYPLNSSADDFAFYGHKNGVTGYVSSNREGGVGSDDIYKFKFAPALDIEGIVTDGINNQPLDSVHIKLFKKGTETLVMETMTDEQGYYRLPVNRKSNYRIEASRKTHPTEIQFLNTYDTQPKTKLIRRDIVLQPVHDLKLLANLNKIYFDFDKSNIRPDAARELDKLVKLMTETYPEMIIKLEAHTDNIGSHEYNDLLSEARAKSTYDYLISKGVPIERIVSYKGFGKRIPVNNCIDQKNCSATERELNRRTEFPILQIKKGVALK